MMNVSGSEFFLDEDPFFAASDRSLADSFAEDFVELLWDNGPVLRRTPHEELRSRAGSSAAAPEPFLEEEEMSSWLHDPIGGGFSPEKHQSMAFAEVLECDRRTSGALKSSVKHQKLVQSAGSGESKVEDSSVTVERMLKVRDENRSSALHRLRTSSEASEPAAPCLDSLKRKSAEVDDWDSISESIDKQDESSRSASKKRQRAAEVHNLSERRRRDRINEKMKALQELVPGSNKLDKASMLDDAIRYMKFLKNHVQMMSMGCPMLPMMVPGAHPHHYLPQMGMPTMPMAMNMGMAMGSYSVPLISGFQATPASPGALPFGSGPAPARPSPPSVPRR
ncbi:uncharacterized protein LOC144700169 [Wolffia australiana]